MILGTIGLIVYTIVGIALGSMFLTDDINHNGLLLIFAIFNVSIGAMIVFLCMVYSDNRYGMY